MRRTKLLKFPTDYPIKVVGRLTDTLRSEIDEIVTRHVPDLDHSRTTERRSANGNFVSISYMIHAKSQEQVVALSNELSACETVLIVI